jgi:hypothetical protein
MPRQLNVSRLVSAILSIQREKLLKSLTCLTKLLLAALGGLVLVGLIQLLTARAQSSEPALDIIKSGPIAANVGDTIAYAFTVRHAVTSDGSPVSNVTISDDIAGSPTFINGDTNGNNQLDADETWVYIATYTIQSTDPDPLVNIVTVEGEDLDGDPISATDSHSTDISYLPAHAFIYMPIIFKNFEPLICSPYFDDFSDPSSGWPIFESRYGQLGYSAGEYFIRNKLIGMFIVQAPTGFANRYAVGVDARWDSANIGYEYGLIFGQTNFPVPVYRFVVDPVNQRYRLSYHNGSSWQCVNTSDPCWVNSAFINLDSAPNHLKVECNGTIIDLYINNQLVWEGEGPTSCGGQAGLVTQAFPDPNALAYFDNFQVSCPFGTNSLSSQSGELPSTMSARLGIEK